MKSDSIGGDPLFEVWFTEVNQHLRKYGVDVFVEAKRTELSPRLRTIARIRDNVHVTEISVDGILVGTVFFSNPDRHRIDRIEWRDEL